MRLVAGLLTAALLAGAYFVGDTRNFAEATSLDYATVQDRITEEERWLAGLQLADGSLPMNRTSLRMVPYFTNLGLMGLVDNPEYAGTVRRWITWYVENLNRPDALGVHGTVYDHEVWYGASRPTQSYDSSDSYAATFLTLVRAYYDTTGDADFLRGIEADLRLVAGAIYSTMDPRDGLTYAKADYRIKYLMDNAEVYRGLLDWAYLLREVYGDAGEAERVEQDAQAVRASLLAMWQGTAFAYAKDERGGLFRSDWAKWYPEDAAQRLPICTDRLAPDDPRAQEIWMQFNEAHPEWVRHGHPDAFPWAVAGYVAAVMQDWAKVKAYAEVIEARYVRMGRPWPWYIAESGWYLRMLKRYAERSALLP